MNRRSFVGLGTAAAAGLLVSGKFTDVLADDTAAAKAATATAKTATAGAGLTVETTAGKVKGLTVGRGVHAFMGVPYGASTAGARRFMEPIKPDPWTGVRESFHLGLRSPQTPGNLVPQMGTMDRTEPMGEDCLCLNVWAPGTTSTSKRPVMVWLHGGGFASGSAGFEQYDGANLAGKHDVVVVGVNHRLNIFGFLHVSDLGDSKFANSANAGMQDIVLALQWVHDNIGNFGGDPARVTIFGQSGGGGKVSTLLGMPGAKGLFHRAIAMSGSAVTSGNAEQATAGVKALLARENTTLAKLQELSMAQVLALMAAPAGGGGRGGRGGAGGGPGLQLAPVVDGRVLPANVFDPVATEISADVPLMISSTETEITWNANLQYDPLSDQELHDRLKQTIRGADDAAVDHVIAVYRKNRPKASNLDLYLIAGSDASNFRSGTDTQAARKAAQGKAPVYKAYFQWYSPVRLGELRAMHTMDIPFVFDNVDIARSEVGSGPQQQALADKMSATVVAFARTGKPDNALIPHWTPYNDPQRATMVWNNETKLINDPYREEKDVVAAAGQRQAAPRTSSL